MKKIITILAVSALATFTANADLKVTLTSDEDMNYHLIFSGTLNLDSFSDTYTGNTSYAGHIYQNAQGNLTAIYGRVPNSFRIHSFSYDDYGILMSDAIPRIDNKAFTFLDNSTSAGFVRLNNIGDPHFLIYSSDVSDTNLNTITWNSTFQVHQIPENMFTPGVQTIFTVVSRTNPSDSFTITFDYVQVPEPSTYAALFGFGLIALAAWRKLRK